MTRQADRLALEEASAKRVILVQAIETVQPPGPWIGAAEREGIDRAVQGAVMAGHGADAGAGADTLARRFLDLRAQRLLELVQQRDPPVAAMQSVGATLAFLAVPALATFFLGAVTDRIADPHRVDLLSLPLLAIVLWNLATYVYLVARRAMGADRSARPGFLTLDRWMRSRDGLGRVGSSRAGVSALFQMRWFEASAPLQGQRWKAVLHLAALGWAAGLAVSLLVRGLVVEYRVGWESTFLDAEQVHAILSAVLFPVLAWLPFESFSVQEVAKLQLGPGSAGVADRRWVWMYVALLGVTVIAPRALLAAAAAWRAAWLARRVPVDLSQPYFQRLLSLIHPAQVKLGLVAGDSAPTRALLRVLAREAETANRLISSREGDTLSYVELSAGRAPHRSPATPHRAAAWGRRLLGALWPPAGQAAVTGTDRPVRGTREEGDVVLLAVCGTEALEATKALLDGLERPVLVLVDPPDRAEPEREDVLARCRAATRKMPGVAAVLSFDAFARCWVQEPVLLGAIGRCLPESQQPGYARLQAAWSERNHARFSRSMAVIAEHLLHAAGQVRELQAPPGSALRLFKAGERQAMELATQAARAAIAQEIEQGAARMSDALKKLHRIEDGDGVPGHAFEPRFQVHQPVHAPQAGIAGAASGAAMGASVDLMVGGLTLGAAAGLGALLGGGAAWLAAAWKNRTLPGGATLVQAGDEMMQALLEAALRHYLAVIHQGGDAERFWPAWKSEVVVAVQAHRATLAPLWAAARVPQGTQTSPIALEQELEILATKLLARLYPEGVDPRPESSRSTAPSSAGFVRW